MKICCQQAFSLEVNEFLCSSHWNAPDEIVNQNTQDPPDMQK